MKVIELMDELQKELEIYTKLNKATDFLNSDIVLQLGNTTANYYTQTTSFIGFLEQGVTLIVGTLAEEDGTNKGEN